MSAALCNMCTSPMELVSSRKVDDTIYEIYKCTKCGHQTAKSRE